MYHRFDENKYPSTNIKIQDFKAHLEFIENKVLNLYHIMISSHYILKITWKKKILLTIDDGFSSFYKMHGHF